MLQKIEPSIISTLLHKVVSNLEEDWSITCSHLANLDE